MQSDNSQNLCNALDRAVEAARDIGITTSFLWSVASDLEFLASGRQEISGDELREHADRLQFLARLYEERQAMVQKVSELVGDAYTIALQPVLASA